MIKVNDIAFIAYPTTDKKRACEFYETLLLTSASMDMDTGTNYWTEFEVGAGTLALSNHWTPASAPRTCPAVALEVQDFSLATAALKAKGVPFVEEAESTSCRMAMVLDPDGNSLWIHQRNPQRGAYKGPELPFVCYPTADKGRSREFFEKRFGFVRTQPDFESPDGFWSEYNVGQSAIATCNFWKPAAEPLMGPAGGLEVEDFSAAVAELKAEGVTFAMEPMEMPGCHFCGVLDPDGNTLFIHQRKPGPSQACH